MSAVGRSEAFRVYAAPQQDRVRSRLHSLARTTDRRIDTVCGRSGAERDRAIPTRSGRPDCWSNRVSRPLLLKSHCTFAGVMRTGGNLDADKYQRYGKPEAYISN